MRHRRNNWEDLPPMFSAPIQDPDYESLPPLFFVADSPLPTTEIQPAHSVTIGLDVPQGLDARKKADNLARAVEESINAARIDVASNGAVLMIPKDEASHFHRAVLAIVGDTAKDWDLREGALRLVEKVEAAAGINPQQGFFDVAMSAGVLHMTAGRFGFFDMSGVQREPVRLLSSANRRSLTALLEEFPRIFVREYSAACREYEAKNLFKFYDDERDYDSGISDEQARRDWRHYHAFGAAMHEFREQLEKAGVESCVAYTDDYMEPEHLGVFWREPQDPGTFMLAEISDKVWWAELGREQAIIDGTAVLRPDEWGVNGFCMHPEAWTEICDEGVICFNRRRR